MGVEASHDKEPLGINGTHQHQRVGPELECIPLSLCYRQQGYSARQCLATEDVAAADVMQNEGRPGGLADNRRAGGGFLHLHVDFKEGVCSCLVASLGNIA